MTDFSGSVVRRVDLVLVELAHQSPPCHRAGGDGAGDVDAPADGG